MKTFTKIELAEISLRPLQGEVSQAMLARLANGIAEMPDHKFLWEFRKSTKLKARKIVEDKYYLVYV